VSSRRADYSPEAWERHKARERVRHVAKYADPTWRAAFISRANRYRDRNRAILNGLRRERGCVDCGATSGRLDFDHRDGETKLFNLAHPRCSNARLMAEVAKCDVRCVACHARRHGVVRGGLNVPRST
jgi:hypothetical protein